MKLVQYFRLVDTQARMALKADSAQYYLGYIWWILEPLLFVAIFYLVFEVFLESHRSDFLIFLMLEGALKESRIPFSSLSRFRLRKIKTIFP